MTVIVKALRGCTEEKVYEASGDSLPGAFIDGTRGDASSVDLVVGSSDYHVSISLKYLDSLVLVRRQGNYLSVAVRMPEIVVEDWSPADSAQLCLGGCRAQELISTPEYLAQPDRTYRKWRFAPPKLKRSETERLCRQAGLVDFYLDACVLDVLVSGDLAFRDAARDALGDARRLFPQHKLLESNRTDLSIYDELRVEISGKAGLRPTLVLLAPALLCLRIL